MRWLRTLLYGASGLFCFASAFFPRSFTALPGLPLLVLGIGLGVVGFRQLKVSERQCVGAVVLSLVTAVGVIIFLGVMVAAFTLWLAAMAHRR